MTVAASLVDSDDPLLSDTTKITFDVAAAEEEAAASAALTPASEDRALLAVSATQRLGASPRRWGPRRPHRSWTRRRDAGASTPGRDIG